MEVLQMGKLLSILLMTCCVSSLWLDQPADAQNFTKRGRGDGGGSLFRRNEPFISSGRSTLGKDFSNFNKQLNNTGSRMRRDYDRSENSAAHRNLVNARAIQADTGRQLQQSFVNTNVQAYNSGG